MLIFFTPTLSNIAKKENDVKEFCMWFANFYIFGWNWSRIGLRSRLLILAPDYYSKNCQIDWLRETLISPFWFSPKVKFSSFSSFYLFNNCSQGLMLWFTLFLNRSFYHTKQCVDPCVQTSGGLMLSVTAASAVSATRRSNLRDSGNSPCSIRQGSNMSAFYLISYINNENFLNTV